MLKVLCTVCYDEAGDTGEEYQRVIDWDNQEQKRDFASKADWAIRNGGCVTTERTDLELGRIE
jgi:hypothetical protein